MTTSRTATASARTSRDKQPGRPATLCGTIAQRRRGSSVPLAGARGGTVKLIGVTEPPRLHLFNTAPTFATLYPAAMHQEPLEWDGGSCDHSRVRRLPFLSYSCPQSFLPLVSSLVSSFLIPLLVASAAGDTHLPTSSACQLSLHHSL
jgi:hypothetical protein